MLPAPVKAVVSIDYDRSQRFKYLYKNICELARMPSFTRKKGVRFCELKFNAAARIGRAEVQRRMILASAWSKIVPVQHEGGERNVVTFELEFSVS